jgi:cytochrome c peroxidase
MKDRRFKLLLAIILLINGTSACSGSGSKPRSTTENVTAVSVWNMSGIPPTATPEPTAVIVSEHAADLDEAPSELDVLRSLWIGSLPPLPSDPSNAVADNPQAAQMGQKLFFDSRFSANGEVSCATCHKPELMFTDGLPRAKGVGKSARSSMTIIGTAYGPWLFWDGRSDSQWAQALAPLEDPAEHGGTRTQYIHIIDEDPTYRAEYEVLFGSLPNFSDRSRFPDKAGPFGDPDDQTAWEEMAPADRETVTQVYVNLGKAIAAYERLIIPGPSRFDTYVKATLSGDEETRQAALTPDEVAGMRLFISENCIYCHNGPLFTDNNFYNIGVPNVNGLPLDYGRFKGLQAVLSNEFNCLGVYSDAGSDDCAKISSIKTGGLELRGAFRVPTLRNIAETAPYEHAGQYATLREVLEHYNQAETGPFGHTEVLPLNFSDRELGQLEAFLRTLSGPLTVDPELLVPPTALVKDRKLRF